MKNVHMKYEIPNHNCGTCGVVNFSACNTKTFTYVIGGIYKGGDVPNGTKAQTSVRQTTNVE